MTGTKISLNGADTAHYRDAMASATRLIPFPDGVQRHITLTNREWEVFDTWQRQNGWHPTRLAELAVQTIREVDAEIGLSHMPYEESIRAALKALILAGMSSISAFPRDSENDNSAMAGSS